MATLKPNGLSTMKTVATAAALLTAMGGGAALAQGAPSGFAPWHSGWPSAIETQPMQAMSARKATTLHPGSRTVVARNGGSVPVASNAQGNPRGS